MKYTEYLIATFIAISPLFGFCQGTYTNGNIANSLVGSWQTTKDYRNITLNINVDGTFNDGTPKSSGTWNITNGVFNQYINGCKIQHEVIWQGSDGFHLKCISSSCSWYKWWTILYYSRKKDNTAKNSVGLGLIQQSEIANIILSSPSVKDTKQNNTKPSWKLCPACNGQCYIYWGTGSEQGLHACYGCGGMGKIYY